MKILLKALTFSALVVFSFTNETCDRQTPETSTALVEQRMTEKNQDQLLHSQPPPRVTWSLERDNLIQRFKLQNDRTVIMYMYIFNYGIANPIGYYQVNKVSSVNSQLTNPEQIICNETFEAGNYSTIASPAEDGSYGENGAAIFGFTPDQVYIEHNMQYVVATAPLNFPKSPNIGSINVGDLAEYKKLLNKLK